MLLTVAACGGDDEKIYGGKKNGSFQMRCGYYGKKIC
tara:strand:+ start:334 stop:444 length:111 start_codon:yes stop_codon:yes gene_type:complete